jgi:hypothetical protein
MQERVSGTPAAAVAAAAGPAKLTLFEAEGKTKKSIESLKTCVPYNFLIELMSGRARHHTR